METWSLIEAVDSQDRNLLVRFSGGVEAMFDYFWLRDHATDAGSYDSRSHQRELFTAAIDKDVRPLAVTLADDGSGIELRWPGSALPAFYGEDFLQSFRAPAGSAVQSLAGGIPWGGGRSVDAARYHFSRVAAEIDSLFEQLVRNGFAIITGCPTDERAVNAVAELLGGVQSTIFGEVWTFAADETRADSAYTPRELRPHTDATYSHDAPGLQMLLCCHYDAEGGESILVDGLAIFNVLKEENADLLRALQSVEVPGQYLGDGWHLKASRPVFRCDPVTGELRQVSFNNYDRAPFRLTDEEMRRFYDGLGAFDAMANDPARQWRYLLKPGEMMIFDNWRVLHGRGAFTGQREMAGCYVSRENFESRLRQRDQVCA